MSQIWIAMIALLLLKYITVISNVDWTVSSLMAVSPVRIKADESLNRINSFLTEAPEFP